MYILVYRRFQQFFSHITTVSGCDSECNAHFNIAVSLKYCCLISQTLNMIPHPDTLSWHWMDQSTPLVWVPSEKQLVPFFTTLVCHGPGSNPWPQESNITIFRQLFTPKVDQTLCGVVKMLSIFYSHFFLFPVQTGLSNFSELKTQLLRSSEKCSCLKIFSSSKT